MEKSLLFYRKFGFEIFQTLQSIDQRLLKKLIEVVENNISNPLVGVEEIGKEIRRERVIKDFTK
jgi:hypothetical protein